MQHKYRERERGNRDIVLIFRHRADHILTRPHMSPGYMIYAATQHQHQGTVKRISEKVDKVVTTGRDTIPCDDILKYSAGEVTFNLFMTEPPPGLHSNCSPYRFPHTTCSHVLLINNKPRLAPVWRLTRGGAREQK